MTGASSFQIAFPESSVMSTANLTIQSDGTALLHLDAATAQALAEAASLIVKLPSGFSNGWTGLRRSPIHAIGEALHGDLSDRGK